MGRKKTNLPDRFWAKVERRGPDECWNWTANRAGDGYGSIGVDGRMLGAHRVAWELTRGAIPKGEGVHGTCVCHRCDNPLCCNPAHLFLGSHTDNVRDMRGKGRANRANTEMLQARGEKRLNAKLTADTVRFARIVCSVGFPKRRVAKALGVSESALRQAVIGETWAHV